MRTYLKRPTSISTDGIASNLLVVSVAAAVAILNVLTLIFSVHQQREKEKKKNIYY
jgi:hypothetical protein